MLLNIVLAILNILLVNYNKEEASQHLLERISVEGEELKLNIFKEKRKNVETRKEA